MKVKLLSGLLLTLALSLALRAQSAQELYQRGLVQEQSRGDLKEAVKLYTEAAKSAGKNRELAAKALVRSAASLIKLGQSAAAADVYAEILKTFPEQRAEVTVAQERLNLLRNASATDVSAVTGPVFESFCSTCHNSEKKSGGLDLADLNARNVAENTARWETLLRRLRARHDPPSGSSRPDDKTYRAVISKLETALDAAYPVSESLVGDRVEETELAARIAMFIWGTAPDASLLADARSGKLHDREVLERQVHRMLRDTRSANVVTSFVQPWLSLQKIKNAQADAELLQAMETETRLFLESQLQEDRDVIDLWAANYTFLNERLARHYGIPGVAGSEFRRVSWPNNSRAGILGQAGPLATLSSGSRTSPTIRGLYILTKFLGMQADPPPANVPPLSDAPDDRAGSMRERLEAHTANRMCANCHVRFDPMGLALENFDAVGRWRTTDSGVTIDASGSLIDGTSFNGPAELRAGLLKYRDAYYTNLTQQLLGHGLNRKAKAVRVYDYEMPSVREIVRTASAKNYRWSSIITGVVSSAPFQMKNIVP